MQTMKQQEARSRNWRIYKLRSYQQLAYCLSGKRRDIVIRVVDDELAEMGAHTFDEHRRKRR